MPKGKVRVYKKDNDGALQFVGEDLIDHTAKDEKIRVYHDAFGLVEARPDRTAASQRSRAKTELQHQYPQSQKKRVTVTSVEHTWGDWKILNSSLPYTKGCP